MQMQMMTAAQISVMVIVFVLCATMVAGVVLWTRMAMAFEADLRPSCTPPPPLESPDAHNTSYALACAAAAAARPGERPKMRDLASIRWVGSQHAAMCVRFERRTIVVAFRGTQTMEDAIVDLDVTLVDSPYGDGRVHRGFLELYQTLRPELLRTLREEYIDGDSLFLTGHSLGAAVATYALQDLLRHDAFRLAVRAAVTFGSPKTGDAVHARELVRIGAQRIGAQPMLRVISNALDPMCTLPAKKYYAPVELVTLFIEERGSWSSNHSMAVYLRAVAPTDEGRPTQQRSSIAQA